MSDAKLVAALQRQASEAEVERLRLVEELAQAKSWQAVLLEAVEDAVEDQGKLDAAEKRITDLEAQLSASHLAAQRMVAEEREACAKLCADYALTCHADPAANAADDLAEDIRARGGK